MCLSPCYTALGHSKQDPVGFSANSYELQKMLEWRYQKQDYFFSLEKKSSDNATQLLSYEMFL